MPATLDDILGPEGAIARRLKDRYEHRPQQLEMARAVEEAFAQKHHLLVETGTGVGKSFAYLLPAIDYAVRQKKRVVISTHTISLQEQLIYKDIPLTSMPYGQSLAICALGEFLRKAGRIDEAFEVLERAAEMVPMATGPRSPRSLMAQMALESTFEEPTKSATKRVCGRL